MLTLTPAALTALEELLDVENASAGQAVRLSYDGDEGLCVAIDDVKPGDVLIRSDRRAVIVLDEAMAEALGDETLDVFEGDEGLQLIIR